MRTVGATDAFWRIYEFELHTRFPTVVSLAIHLEDEQNIYFKDDTKFTAKSLKLFKIYTFDFIFSLQ